MSGLLDKANKTAAEKTEVVPDEIASEESLQLDSKITTGLQKGSAEAPLQQICIYSLNSIM